MRPKVTGMATRTQILETSLQLFLEKGYSGTYVSVIAKKLNRSTGLLTFWFPTKEHILAELVQKLFEFQWNVEEEKQDLLAAYLYELALITSVCDENPNIQDLITAAYTHPLSLAIIRDYDTKRAKEIFSKYCPDWKDTDYILAENIASGIECSMLMTVNTENISFEQRVESSLNTIMTLYNVPDDVRKRLLAEVMVTDYRSKGSRVFEEFCNFIEENFFINQEEFK